MSDQSPDVGISLEYDNLTNLPNILSPKIYIDFTSEPLPTDPFDATDSLSFHDIGRFYEPLFESAPAFKFNSIYDKELLYFPEGKVGFIGGFSLTSQGFYCKSFFTPPLPTPFHNKEWEVSLAFINFYSTENSPYPDGYVGEGIWAVFNSITETIEIKYLDAAQNEQVLESIKFSIQNTGGNPVEIGFQWDGFKSFKAYYGDYSVTARSNIFNSFESGLFYPVAIMNSTSDSGGEINGGMDSLEFGCSIGFNNINPSPPDRGVTLGNISTSDYLNLETVDKNSFTSTVRNVGLEPVFTLDNCPPEYCNPAGDVEEGNVRIGVLSWDDSKFEEPICEYLRSDFFEGELYGYYSNGDKIRIVESSLGDKYLVSRNLDASNFNFHQVIDGEFNLGAVGWVAYFPGMVDFDWFNDRLWIYGQDSGYSIRSFSEAFNYTEADISIANPSSCNSIAYHQESNSFYASYPEDDAIIQYDADDGSVLDTLYVTSFDIIKLVSCGDYIAIIDRESDAINVLSDDSRTRFLNPETNTIVKSFFSSDPNDVIYDNENNCVYLFTGENTAGATPTPENDGMQIYKLPLNTLSNATPTISFQWAVSTSEAERNISDLFVYNNQIYIVSNGNLYIRSTSNGSLVSTENFDSGQEVLSVSHEIIDGATPSEIVWTIGIDTNATPVSDGNMLFYKNCSYGNKLGIKSRIVFISDSATPLASPASIFINANEIPVFINECIDNNTIPSIVIFMENWDNVDENKQSIDEIINYIHGPFGRPIPVLLTVLPTPDIDFDPDLTQEESLVYWKIYQRYVRKILDLGISNGVKDYEYISFCCVISAESILEMADNPSLEADRWLDNTWDLPVLFSSLPIEDEEPPVDYTPEGLLILAGPTFDWLADKNVSKMIVAFDIQAAGDGSAAADFYQAAYDLALSSGSNGSTPNVEPQTVAIIMNDIASPASDLFLRQIKLSLGYETSLMANEGYQSKILYNNETTENFSLYASNFILDNQLSYLIFGDKNTFENIVENSGTPVDDYIQLFNEIQQNVSGPYHLYGPNIDISSRDEGYDQVYNGVLMDSRYIEYLEDFINVLNSSTPTFNPAGLAFTGDFSSEEWVDALSYIRETLSFSGEILISNIDPNPSYDSNISYKQKSQAVINELGPADKVFVTDNYIFTGSFENFTSEWAFVGSLNLVSQADNVIFKIISYSESILADGYLEIESDNPVYSYSSDLEISGSSINLGNLDAGTYSIKIFGMVGAEGEAHMNLKFEFDNFDAVSLSSKRYFYLGG